MTSAAGVYRASTKRRNHIFGRAIIDLPECTSAMERQECEFQPGAHWQIQGAKFRMPGNTAWAGKDCGLLIPFSPQ